MEKEFKKKGLATFEGFSIGRNLVVTIKFKFSSSEILTSIELLSGLNNDISVLAKLPGKKTMMLGLFTVGGLKFDKDGNATIPFNSMVDSVDFDFIQEIICSDSEKIQLMFKALLELPEQKEKE